MSCSCHIDPPCSYCLEKFECDGCGDIKHSDEDGKTYINGLYFCDYCLEKI